MLILYKQHKTAIKYCALFIFVLIAYHVSINIYGGDDLRGFSKALQNSTMVEYLTRRYNTWSSRVIIEALLVLSLKNIFLWKIANIAVYSILAYSLYILSDKSSLLAVFSLLLMYPLTDMASAGWVATFLNYLWPLSFGMYSLTVLYKLTIEKSISWKEVVCSIITCAIGANAEQCCAMQLAIIGMFTVIIIVNHNYEKIWLFLIHYSINIFSLVFIFMAPGNTLREQKEVINWMKDFYEKNFLDKLIDGFERTFSVLLSSNNIIFLILTILIFLCVYKKTKNIRYRVIGGLPLICHLAVILGKADRNGYFVHYVNLISSNVGVDAYNWINLSSYIPLTLYAFIATCIVISFFIIFDDLIKSIECSFLFTIAIATSVVMGFSPTLFASSRRTLIFCYFLIVLIILRIWKCNSMLFSNREKTMGKSSLWILTALIMVNNIALAGSKYL